MIIVCEGVRVKQELDSVTLFDQGGDVVGQSSGQRYSGLKPSELEGVQLGEGKRLTDPNVEDKRSG